jgi:hypothetical protein
MNIDHYRIDNCVNLIPNNDTVSYNSTSLTMEVQPLMWSPILTYREERIEFDNSSVLHYEWCGPLILLMKIFAKHINAK